MNVNIVQLIVRDMSLLYFENNKCCTKLLPFLTQVIFGSYRLILNEICCICVSSLYYSGTGEK